MARTAKSQRTSKIGHPKPPEKLCFINPLYNEQKTAAGCNCFLFTETDEAGNSLYLVQLCPKHRTKNQKIRPK